MTHRHDILNLGQNFHEEPTYGTTTANVNQSEELQDLSHFLGFVSFAKIPFLHEDTHIRLTFKGELFHSSASSGIALGLSILSSPYETTIMLQGSLMARTI